jgi:hypothetical protein
MSGPKVVRIVTREEILDICHGQLARVDAALADWTRVGLRNDCITEEAIAAARGRREQLAALIATDQFMALQKQAPIEEAFLREDLQRRLGEVISRERAAQTRAQREREAGASLLRALASSGQEVPSDLASALERGEAPALAAGFQLLSKAAPEPEATRQLASQFRENDEVSTYADWLARQPAAPADPAIERIEQRLSELSLLASDQAASEWRLRLAEAAEAPTSRRNLLLDGLEVETGRALRKARKQSVILSDLSLLWAEMAAAGLSPERVDQATSAATLSELQDRLSVDRETLEEHRARKAVAARRAAVLQGLAGLGYEVTEGMSTSFATEGRAMLRSASRPDYGVEVSAAAGGGRVQMRPVAFQAGAREPDPARDKDAETIWCGDVSALQDSLSALGGELIIERSTPIGATPLKRVNVDERSASATEISRPKERHLPR